MAEVDCLRLQSEISVDPLLARDAVDTAVTAGSMATRAAGVRSGIPTLDEVRAFRA